MLMPDDNRKRVNKNPNRNKAFERRLHIHTIAIINERNAIKYDNINNKYNGSEFGFECNCRPAIEQAGNAYARPIKIVCGAE